MRGTGGRQITICRTRHPTGIRCLSVAIAGSPGLSVSVGLRPTLTFCLWPDGEDVRLGVDPDGHRRMGLIASYRSLTSALRLDVSDARDMVLKPRFTVTRNGVTSVIP